MLVSSFTLSIVGVSLSVLSLLLLYILYRKYKKIANLNQEISLLQNSLKDFENRLQYLEQEFEDEMDDRKSLELPEIAALQIHPTDTALTKTGKHWAQKIYQNPEKAFGIVTSSWMIFNRLFKKK